MNDGIRVKGSYKLKYFKDGELLFTEILDNVVTTSGLTAIAKVLADSVTTSVAQYIAFGDGVVAVNAADIVLTNETGRILPISVVQATNTIVVTGLLDNSMLNGTTVAEVGIFGVDADDTVDSGTMLSHVLVGPALPKTNANQIEVEYTLTLS